ncbi:MAG: hypothetical protein JSS82_14320 [Bacteroidetes bacterium]|nr:hypothetical protein [Bacteroidota bacterium]
MRVYLDTNYPKNLAEALRLIHALQLPQAIEIVRTQDIKEADAASSILFLFDQSKKGLDVVTEKHFEAGYRVFAFKLNSTDKINFFDLSLSLLRLWPRILDTITAETEPFVFTYNYNGKTLTKVKGRQENVAA